MYFQCPKIVGDNVDLSKLKLYVNFENANKERDNYFVDDVTVNEGNILFSWLFSRKVTKYKGDVKFIVCAKKSEDNLTLEWNTTVAKGLSLEGIEVELSDEEQSIASDYLIQLEKELSALAETENNRLLTTSSNQITNIINKGSEQVQLVENTAKKALDSIPSTYTDLQKQVNEIDNRTTLGSFFENMFALQRTGKVYTVKFPLWETSHISTGEKLDANAGLICEPSTKKIKGQDDYENIPLFKTYDVNAYVDDEGVRHVTAIKGDGNFKDEGKVDVFVLGMSYYEKVWEDEQYWYYSRTDSPREGYTIAKECINRDGTIQAFGLYAKYVAGNIDGNLYSSKGLKPARYYGTTPLPANTTNTNTSYSGLISQCHKRGSFYSGGMTCDYKYILTTFYLKYGTLNTQSIMSGCNNYNAQYEASIKSSTNNTYFPLTKAQADYFPVGASVSIGYKYGGSNLDRYYSTVSIYADNVKIIKKVALDDSNTALYLDTNTPFNTANTSSGAVFCSAMQWRSGFSDDILGRDGCPCETKSELTNGKFPIVIQGIECMVGGYETYGNAFMDIVDATGKREVYIQNDTSLLTTDMTTAKTTYKKSPYAIQPTKLNNWNYITRIDFDLENGAFVQTNVGQDGSGTAVGFADGVYVDNGWGNNNIANDTLLDDEFIKRDIFNTNQNVSNSACQTQRDVLESRYTTQLGMQNLQASQQECCCTTQRAIDNVVAQDYKNTCEITTAIHAEGEATRALINANTMQELRDRLADRDRDLLTANFQLSQQAQSANIISTLQPTPKPAYLTCSPYYAYNSGACFGNGCGCNGTNL